jgi:MFS family permease
VALATLITAACPSRLAGDRRMTASATPVVPSRRYRPGTIRAALSYPRFRVIFIATAMSSVGTWMQNFTLPAYIDERTGSAAMVGLMVFTQLGPLLLLSLPAGVLADRFDRTKFVVTMQAVMLVASVSIAVLITNESPLWTLFAAQLVVGIANALNAPAFSSSIPLLVDRQDLPGAVSLNAAMINGSRVAGPALAAMLTVFGMTIAQLFIVNGVTYLFLIIPLVRFGLPSVRGKHPEQGWRRLMTGINIVRRRQLLSRALVAMMLFSLFSLPFVGLFPSVARLNLGLDPTGSTYKWLYVVWGSGAFFGALAVGSVFAGIDKRRLVPIGFMGFGVSLAAFALVRSPAPAFPIAFVLGFVYFLTATAISTVVQQNVGDAERVSVMPLWFMSFGGTVPIGNLLAGPLIDRFGARPVLLVGAGFAVFLAWWADLARIPLDPLPAQEVLQLS